MTKRSVTSLQRKVAHSFVIETLESRTTLALKVRALRMQASEYELGSQINIELVRAADHWGKAANVVQTMAADGPYDYHVVVGASREYNEDSYLNDSLWFLLKCVHKALWPTWKRDSKCIRGFFVLERYSATGEKRIPHFHMIMRCSESVSPVLDASLLETTLKAESRHPKDGSNRKVFSKSAITVVPARPNEEEGLMTYILKNVTLAEDANDLDIGSGVFHVNPLDDHYDEPLRVF